MFEQVERQVGDYVEWLRLLVEALGALVIAAGVVLVIAGLVRHLLSQLGAAFIGMACFLLLRPGYLSAGTAMVLAIVAMILCDAVHPPAVAAGSMRSPPAAHMACAASGKRKKGCMLCMQPFDPATEFWCR